MSHRVVIRLFASGASEWLALDRGGAVLEGPAAGLPTTSAPAVDLLLPAEHVLLLEAPRLARRSSQLARALPYAIEEQLAGAVEQQHVAFDERGGGSSLAVAVVARERLQQALTALSNAGHSADRCRSTAQLLPLEPGILGILIDGDEALLRWGRSATMSCRVDELAQSIALLRDAGADWQRIHLWRGERSALLPPDMPEFEDKRIGNVLAWYAERFGVADGPDLLQGEFRPKRRGSRSSARWRWAAGLAAAAVLAALLQAGLEQVALQKHVEARRVEMEGLLREAMPGTQRIVDPVAQLGAELTRRRGGGGGGALPLLAKVAPLIAGSGRYTIEALDYREGTLELTVSAPDVAALDSLRASLAALPPLRAELTSALPGSSGYEGRLRIREGS